MKISFVDLHAQYLSIKPEIDEAIARVISNSSYIGGVEVVNFEYNFSKWLGVDYFIGCANGTDSIEMLLKAMDVGPGDEVIVPAMSWISTSEAVSTCGAKPIFVDIHPEYYTIDEELIERYITTKTKVIIPVHLYGQPCNMTKIMEIAERHNLWVLEDCAQAHGTRWDGKRVGTFGHASSFSFFPGKNLGAYGDAGGMGTNDLAIAERVRMIANHGQKGKHNHIIEGRNSRLDGLQAAVLNVKLKYLDDWITGRQAVAKEYGRLLESCIGVKIPAERQGGLHSYHLYVIQIENRDVVKERLIDSGVESAIHYPTPLPFLSCYKENENKECDFPNVLNYSKNILSLPIYPELSKLDIENISNLLY